MMHKISAVANIRLMNSHFSKRIIFFLSDQLFVEAIMLPNTLSGFH